MNILIIGTNRGAHYELIKQGHHVTVLSKIQTVEQGDTSAGYHRFLLIDQNASDEEYIAISGAIHAVTPFDGVHSFHDGYQVLADKIGKQLSLRCLNNGELTNRLHNKAIARQLLVEAKLSDVSHQQVNDFSHLSTLAVQLDYPVIAKPIIGTGSIGVTRLDSDKDIAALKHADFPMVVEKFFEGQEFSVEVFSEQGVHRVIAITEQFKIPDSFIEAGHLVPARISVQLNDKITTYIYQVLDVLGVSNGPSHTEILCNEQRVEFVESHTRTAGDEIPVLVAQATGVDLYAMEARQVAGEKVLEILPEIIIAKQSSAVWFKWPNIDQPYRIEAIRGIDNANKMDGVYEAKLEKQVGELAQPLRHSFDRIAFAIANSADGDTALATAQKAMAGVQLSFKAISHS